MTENRLDRFVVDSERMKVCREAASKCVPSVPTGKGSVALIDVSLRFVLVLLLSADNAL